MKKLIAIIIILVVLMLGVNIVGASIESSGVIYNSKTLNTVLDDLYSKITEINSTGDAVSNQILNGKTALVKGNLITGTMTNKAGSTVTSTKVTKSGNNALITIPSAGYYDTNSKISVPITTINSQTNSFIPKGTDYNLSGEVCTSIYSGQNSISYYPFTPLDFTAAGSLNGYGITESAYYKIGVSSRSCSYDIVGTSVTKVSNGVETVLIGLDDKWTSDSSTAQWRYTTVYLNAGDYIVFKIHDFYTNEVHCGCGGGSIQFISY